LKGKKKPEPYLFRNLSIVLLFLSLFGVKRRLEEGLLAFGALKIEEIAMKLRCCFSSLVL